MIRISTGPRSPALAFVAALVIVPASQALAPGGLRLDGLPHYEAGPELSGTIRNFGFGLGGVLGPQRSAGRRGFKGAPSGGRGAQNTIRTGGQLGRRGEGADKPIQTYGHAPSGTTRFFQWKVLKNGDKWNPNYREYVESASKMIADEDRAEQRMGLQHMLRDELAHDRYGIAWTVMPQARGVAGIKPIALAALDGGPYIAASTASFQDRS